MTSPTRRIYANRTLNLRSIRAVGYDMDYTLAHYNVEAWERRAYEVTRGDLAGKGWPVEGLAFDPDRMIRGLTIDLEHGNLVKPTRFGYVIKASHGTRQLGFDEIRKRYASTVIDLTDDRFVFLNTLFSLSEAMLYAQLVDLLDAGALAGPMSYRDLYAVVADALDEAHMEGTLKGSILEDPDTYVVDDPELAATLLDQKAAGKRLLLITNSEWAYTRRLMPIVLDPHLPDGTRWRDLFDVVIVSAAKPGFFSGTRPLYRIVDEDRGLLEPHRGAIEQGAVYFGGCASELEDRLGLSADEILYVGDHLFADVHVSKDRLRWRTALILRELEDEIEASEAFAADEARLRDLMAEKTSAESALAATRLARLRTTGDAKAALDAEIAEQRTRIEALDAEIGPLAKAAGELANATWGPLMRSGNDKSLFARQVERYADVYTSRVSNFLHATPYGFLRAARSSLPHDS